jgi:hypothetical protein
MAIYLDLLPAPQFDRSLVTYCVTNFNTIKNAFMRMQSTISGFVTWRQGPWPRDVIVEISSPATVTVWCETTCFVTIAGGHSLLYYWNGVQLPQIGSLYFNEPNTHKKITSYNIIRNQASGVHTFRIAHAHDPDMASDTFDRARLSIMAYDI